MSKQLDAETFQLEASELLATEILRAGTDAYKGLANFSEFMISADASVSEKQNQILKLQMTLFGQMLVPLIGDEVDPIKDRKAKMARSLYGVLEDLSSSVYAKADYESQENIDFEHPKIQKAFEFIIEAVLETLTESGVEIEVLNSFLSAFAVKMTGFESELASRMKGLRGAALDKVSNPLMSDFKKMRKEYSKPIEANVLPDVVDDLSEED